MWLMLESLLLTVGTALIVIEVLLIPGFGVPGIVGALMLAAGAFVGFSEVSMLGNVLSLGAALSALGATVKIAPRFVPPETLVLKASLGASTAVPAELAGLLGFGGTTVTPLRPAGIARINGRTVDVVSGGGYVDSGQLVHVVKVEGARVVVELTENRR